jgi:hypothetical protein
MEAADTHFQKNYLRSRDFRMDKFVEQGHDLKEFDLLQYEIFRNREKSFPFQTRVIDWAGRSSAKDSEPRLRIFSINGR